MAYFIFKKNSDGVVGSLYRIAENESYLNNLNINPSNYKVIEDSQSNFVYFLSKDSCYMSQFKSCEAVNDFLAVRYLISVWDDTYNNFHILWRIKEGFGYMNFNHKKISYRFKPIRDFQFKMLLIQIKILAKLPCL
jgi:hypothetical protein